MYAEVILSKVVPQIDKIYHYSIPENLKSGMDVGMQVLVPFGKRKEVGYVVGFAETSDIKGIKDIDQILSPYPLFTKESVEIAKWISKYYNSFLITALRIVMPPGMTKIEKRALKEKKRTPLYRKGSDQTDQKSKKMQEGSGYVTRFKLTEHQEGALAMIEKELESNNPLPFLLYGITGSGKTEVYLRAIEKVLSRGKSSIMLVPEVGLTPILLDRFAQRFGNVLSVYHSDMTIKQREAEWNRIASGEAKVVFGTRSALFTPVRNIGLIVMDEEYENTYKSEQNPKYHARDVALKLCDLNGALLILGSATPSVETFYRAKTGEYGMAVLPDRIDNRPLPPVEVVDMRRELKSGNRGVLSTKLRAEIKKVLEAKKQVILFINRRGYFTFVMCRECGYTIECPKCSVPMIFHMNDKKLQCGHCGFVSQAPLICPKCQGSSVKYFGTGTQRIEKEVMDIFPYARVIRLDRDTVKKKGSYEKAIKVFASGEADVLIGTQIVTKGLDLESVTLVGAVSADIGLKIPDFRAAEHTFQLLTQVAGRAGRHFLPGKVIIQTYEPDHFVIKAASAHSYESFYQDEIKEREELSYPPFARLINIVILNQEESKARKLSKDFCDMLARRKGTFEIMGPVRAFIPKLRGEFRYQVILKGKDMEDMRSAATESMNKVVKLGRSRISIDIDPQNIF